jgi:serine/threonine protein kinase/Tfp pilus assembly protein PilF
MSGNRERMRDIFDRARRLPKPDRAAFLNGLEAVDGELRAHIEDMLAALDEAGPFLSEPTQGHGDASPTVDSAAAVTMVAPLREGPGTRIGPYKLLQLIGEGGFGSVFMAEQEKPVSRKVALKIIKLGMDTRQVVARFEQERQALAMMDHPNIARVLDAGATETGRPFFVMELVKGDPIVEYADKNNLTIDERLDLFAHVCTAVQHAHTKGIIHRDIKPSNILVSTQDGRPHTKVIDFGIAKATASKLTEKTLFTEHKALIGTPEYMSPEQAEGNLDIDTRTDVYSLGVLLYELLTGTTPFTGKELRSAAFGELQRIIREVEPPKPSTRISQNTDTIASVAAKRHTEPKRLGTIVRGELDWIVMKALEKDRHRRYDTANGLAMDIRRYLSGEAVNAAPPSTMYRFKKFVRRNRVLVSAGSAVAAALLIGMVAFAWQFKLASDQRDIAVQAEKAEAEQRKLAETARAEAVAQQTKAELQEAEARKQAAIAVAVAKFQTEMLATVDPANLPKDPATGEPLKDGVTVVQAIEATVKKLDSDGEGEGSLKDQPMVEAAVRDTIGTTLQGLGRYADAEPNLRKSLAIRRAALPSGHQAVADSLINLAALLQAQNKLAEAESLYREALAIRRAALPAGHPDIATGLNNLASLLQDQNKPAEAEPLYREAMSIRRAALPPGHPDIALGLNNLAVLLVIQKRLAEAEPLMREALDIRRASLPAGHPDIALGLNNLAALLQDQNKFAQAEPLYRESLAIRRAALPAGHPNIAASLNNLARFLRAQNKPAEAEPLYREALAIYRAALPAGHPDLATAMTNLAVLLQTQNKLAQAEPLMREALDITRAALPPGHPHIAENLNHLAGLLQAQNKPAEAEPLLREALAMNRAALPAGDTSIATGLSNLARLQQGLGKAAEARAGWDEAIAMLRQGSPNGSPLLARVLWRSGSARLENKDAAAALPELEEAVAIGERVLPAEHPQLNEYRTTLANCKAAIAGGAKPAKPDTKGGG